MIFLQERYPQPWVQGMIDLLWEINQAVATVKQAGQTALTAEQIADCEQRYCELLSEGEKANPLVQAESSPKSVAEPDQVQRGIYCFAYPVTNGLCWRVWMMSRYPLTPTRLNATCAW